MMNLTVRFVLFVGEDGDILRFIKTYDIVRFEVIFGLLQIIGISFSELSITNTERYNRIFGLSNSRNGRFHREIRLNFQINAHYLTRVLHIDDLLAASVLLLDKLDM